MRSYDKAMNLQPNDKVYHANRSATLRQLHRYDEALEEAKKCVDLDPDWTKVCADVCHRHHT